MSNISTSSMVSKTVITDWQGEMSVFTGPRAQTHRKLKAVHLHCCYCDSMTSPWCWYWHLIKRLKIARSWLMVLQQVTSLGSAGSHSAWGEKKPLLDIYVEGVNWRTNPHLLPLFFSPFPVSSQCLPFSRPLWWDPLFCFLLFVWVAWKPWQLSSWEGFFSFYWCDWGGWKVTRSAYGWYAL